MPWTVEYVPERDMALVVATGEIFDHEARGQVAETIRLLQEHRANLALLDYAEALTEVLLSSLYWLPEYAAELGAPWNLRVAVVTPRTRFRIEMYYFFELVFNNAGYDVKLFDNKEAAGDWLGRASPVQVPAK